jgi:hypothetical protein
VGEALYSILSQWLKDPLSLYKNFLNWNLAGPAGTGKTEMAKALAGVLSALSMVVLMQYNDLDEVVLEPKTSNDFIGGYAGETPNKTSALLFASMETVLFIDEAYSITDDAMYGKQAIHEIVMFLSTYQGSLICIAAGYEQKMIDQFLNSNEGLPRRFPEQYRLLLSQLTAEQAQAAFLNVCHREGIKTDPAAARVYAHLFWHLSRFDKNKNPGFAQYSVISGGYSSIIRIVSYIKHVRQIMDDNEEPWKGKHVLAAMLHECSKPSNLPKQATQRRHERNVILIEFLLLWNQPEERVYLANMHHAIGDLIPEKEYQPSVLTVMLIQVAMFCGASYRRLYEENINAYPLQDISLETLVHVARHVRDKLVEQFVDLGGDPNRLPQLLEYMRRERYEVPVSMELAT